MKHKHAAKDLFPTWYKSIDPAVDATVVDSRIKTITTLLEKDVPAFWLDVVRIALGIAPVEIANFSELENAFKEEDVNFPLVSNENILKILSQILLCFLFEIEDNFLVIKIAMAVKNAVFFEQYGKSEVPFYEYANEIFVQPSKVSDFDHEANRKAVEDAIEGMETELEEEVLMDYTDQVALIKTVQFLYDQNASLQQESSIMWWLFGQFSSTNNAYFIEVGLQKMVLAAAIELSELNISKANLPSARHLIHKVLFISNENKPANGKLSVASIIETASHEIKNKALSNSSNISAFTPCLLAMNISTQFDDASIWKNALKSKLPGANIETEFNAVDIAFQIYNEIMFLASL